MVEEKRKVLFVRDDVHRTPRGLRGKIQPTKGDVAALKAAGDKRRRRRMKNAAVMVGFGLNG